MVIVYFDTSLLEYESEPGIPPYFLRLVGPIQLYLHWSQKTLVHIADALSLIHISEPTRPY